MDTSFTRFVRDSYVICVICVQIACHAQKLTTDPNRVKLAQKPEFVCDQYAIHPLGLCDWAFRLANLQVKQFGGTICFTTTKYVTSLMYSTSFHTSVLDQTSDVAPVCL